MDSDGIMSVAAWYETIWDWRWKDGEEVDFKYNWIDGLCQSCRGWYFLYRCYHVEIDDASSDASAYQYRGELLVHIICEFANFRARTLTGTRAERNEFILLHEFTNNGYICPDKLSAKAKLAAANENHEEDENGDPVVTGGKKKDKYKGGLVLEPLKGLYDKFILVMDFNSLYPSIIQEYNICFTTVERADFVCLLSSLLM